MNGDLDPGTRGLDIRRIFRYARARVYSTAVRVHAAYYFRPDPPLSVLAPLCERPCEVVGLESPAGGCLCLNESASLGFTDVGNRHIPQLIPAPFTGTPYDPHSEED